MATDHAAVTADRRAARAGDQLLRRLTRHSAARAAALALVAVAAAGFALFLPAALGHTLDLLLGRRDGRATWWVLLCAALVCGATLLEALEEILTGTVTARGTAWLRHRLTRHVLTVGPRATAWFTPGDLVTRLVGNAAEAGAAPAALAACLAAVSVPVGGVIALVLINPWLAAAFLAGAPVLALLLRAFTRASTDCVARYQAAQGAIAGRLVEAIDGARTVAAAGTADRETARILAPLPELTRQGRRMWRVLGRSAAQSVLVVPLLQIIVLAVGGLLLVRGRLSVGDLLAVSRYAVLATGVGALSGQLNALVRARTAAGRLALVLAEPATAYGTRRLPPGGDGTLELRSVTVVRGGTAVLRDVDLRVPAGVSMALVGRSGAGKSLLAAVAGRLTDPDGGVALLDGVPLWELDREELRRAVTFAFERPALLGGTVGGTIAFGAFTPSHADLTRAARAAHADAFARRLPDGYDTPCAGVPLSGGEVQRLGLARAFAHAGRLLVLDDATSSLDTVTERQVGEALVHQVGTPTRLIVAHRAATAARADLVAWLDGGRIRAVGEHDRLWRLDGYRAVFDACEEDR